MRISTTLGDRAGSATPPTGTLVHWLRSVARVVRTVVGAPDYDRYLSHMRDHHPECQPVPRDEFMCQRLESRYSQPGARCC